MGMDVHEKARRNGLHHPHVQLRAPVCRRCGTRYLTEEKRAGAGSCAAVRCARIARIDHGLQFQDLARRKSGQLGMPAHGRLVLRQIDASRSCRRR